MAKALLGYFKIMKFEFDNGGEYRYEFIFKANWLEFVEIRTYDRHSIGGNTWVHSIKDGQIIWRHDDFMHLTREAKNYISKILKMKAFW